MNHSRRLAALCAAALGFLLVTGCAKKPEKHDRIVLGFSQIGAESEWRTANTE